MRCSFDVQSSFILFLNDYIKPFHLIEDYSKSKKIIELLYKEFLIDLKKETLKTLYKSKTCIYLNNHPRLYTKINGWIDCDF